jgi:hypothetical protein
MSILRNQTTKAARLQSDRGPLPTPTPSWIAQTKRCKETEDIHGTRTQLPTLGGTETMLDISPVKYNSKYTPESAFPPTSNQNTISRNNTEYSKKHKYLDNNHITTERNPYQLNSRIDHANKINELHSQKLTKQIHPGKADGRPARENKQTS